MKRTWKWICGLLAAALLAGCGNAFLMKAHLEETVVRIDGEERLALGDLTYYICVVEETVQQQARAYQADNPKEYWNLYTNGRFLKMLARDLALNTAIHDEILSMAAKEEGLLLSEEDEEAIRAGAREIYGGMTEFARAETGLDEEKLATALRRVGMAKKYIAFLMETKGVSELETELGGDYYEGMQKQHDIVVNEALWEQVDFGTVTLEENR